jgi:CHASE1-domain containing sensor protein
LTNTEKGKKTMSDEQKVQVEDNPVVEEVQSEAENIPIAPPAKKGFVDRALPWVIVSLVFFLVGALLTWFLLYQPKVAELEASKAEVATAAETAATLQGQLDDANTALTAAQADLDKAQETIAAQEETIKQTELLKVIYKFQADVNAARATLSKLDPASSRQALSFVEADLSELEAAGLEPDALSGSEPRLMKPRRTLKPP